MEQCTALRELDLYDNRLAQLEGLEACTRLTYLDVSFNVIERVENLSHLTCLEELYLIENKLSQLPPAAEFDAPLSKLTLLELGGNRFRSLGALQLPLLTKLWVGKNKLTSLRDVRLPHLRLLSMQSNRLVTFRELPAFERLDELYLSHNGLETLADLAPSIVRTLRVLDVGTNRVTSLAALPAFRRLAELWINNNKLETMAELEIVKTQCGATLECLFAEGNPLASSTQYRPKVALLLEQLEELDGTPLVRPNWAPPPSN